MSAMLCVMTLKHTVRGIQDTLFAPGYHFHPVFLEYTHDEYCNMLLTGTACSTNLVLMHWNTCYVIPVNAVKTLACSDERISVFTTGSVTPKHLSTQVICRLYRHQSMNMTLAYVNQKPWQSSCDIT